MAKILNISAENFLSLQDVKLTLRPLNVLVGPNGSGKTNILKLFQFIGDVARLDLVPAIEAMGDFENLLFRGKDRKGQTVKLKFSGVISQHASHRALDEYTLSFWQRKYQSRSPGEIGRRLVQRNEEIILKRTAGRGRRITLNGGSLRVLLDEPTDEKFASKKSVSRKPIPGELRLQNAATGLATLRRLGEEYEASGVEALAQIFEQLRLFEIDVDRVRRPSRISTSVTLRADAGNLASYLLYLKDNYSSIFEAICEDVRYVLPGFTGFEFHRIGGSDEAIRLDIVENSLSGTTPLARASFGTIRSIALFAMLHDPNPPSLTCLEEIDHGLHPYALDRLVDRLRDASKKTQIILATHSPAFVNRLNPDELIVVERNEDTGGTRITQPNENLVETLKAETGYNLGELWFSGAIGGVI
ncbi:ATPase [Prosthecomicrobium hirschii]|uniref:AAA family ATPase n=1 Tax=Prosthecodimorpha hirschii TaxID=665126 RepID=UPI0011261251|nr:AAA family ATPase [Prosthecomicrobium hirschii]TPQ50481.1 ATPase [Prosthecomicrobium hirschii]